MDTKKIAVLGAGSWGTALSMVLADNGWDVRLWSHRAEAADAINKTHENARYLPGVRLPESIRSTAKIEETLADVDHIVLVVPAKAVREVLRLVRGHLCRPAVIVHGIKGIEPDTFMRISEIIEEELPRDLIRSVSVLSGPSHAEEVSLRHPTTVSVASKEKQAAKYVQNMFFNHYFRVYTNDDVVGVEIGGALKNIIALGAGLSDGLGYGDNAKAALITRGLAEISRLGVQAGAHPLTFIGLAGMGDLIVTCTSVHSRNWKAGHMLGKGCPLERVLDEMGMTVEGVRTTKAAYVLARREHIEMPITTAIYQILFEHKDPKTAVDDLMDRDRKDEIDTTWLN